MTRFLIIAAVAGLLTMPAFGQVDPVDAEPTEQREARPEAAQAQPVQQQRIQQQITDLYVSDFRNDVQLSDDQFLKLNSGIRNFMRMQFETARRRQAFKQQIDQLMNQPNPSETDVQRLIDAKNQFDREAATSETRFLTRIGNELSPAQKVRVMEFNRKFMGEKLPGLIQQARDRSVNPAAVRKGNQKQVPAPVVRPNANRPNAQGRPGAALRGRNK